MKIVYLGNFKWSFCTESHISKTLELMGHEVIRLQEDMTGVDHVIEEANNADLFLWTRTPGLLQGDGWQMIRKIKVPKISYHLDLYMGLSREKDVPDDPFFFTDYVFQADGDPESMEKFKALGINAYWMPPAVYGPEMKLGTPKEEFKHDTAFIGNYNYGHEEWREYRQKVLDMVKDNFDYEIYPNAEYPIVMDQTLNDVLASTQIMIGDSVCLGLTHKNYWSNRLVEEIGRGGFVIFPKIPGIETQFELDRELITYELGNMDDLKHKIKYWLEHPGERSEIQMAGFERAKRDHTFERRLQEVFKIIGKE